MLGRALLHFVLPAGQPNACLNAEDPYSSCCVVHGNLMRASCLIAVHFKRTETTDLNELVVEKFILDRKWTSSSRADRDLGLRLYEGSLLSSKPIACQPACLLGAHAHTTLDRGRITGRTDV